MKDSIEKAIPVDPEDEASDVSVESRRRDMAQTSDLVAANAALHARLADQQARINGLLVSEARLRQLVESTRIIPYEADLTSGQFFYVGSQASEILGYPPEEWYRENFWADHLHPDDRRGALAFWESLARGFRDTEFEYRFIAADGRVVFIRDYIGVTLDSRGRPILHGFMADDTTARLAEEDLIETRSIVQAVIQMSPVAIIMIDLEGRVAMWNEAAAEMFGWRESEVLGEPLPIIPPGREAELQTLMQKTKTGERARIVTSRRTRRGVCLDVNLSTSPFYDGKGEIVGGIGVFVDMTERNRLEREIIDISAREQQRIGHDLHDGLCQYLTGIAFAASSLREELQTGDPQRAADAQQIVSYLNTAIGEAKEIARGLAPVELGVEGLGRALRCLAEQVEKLFGIRCHCGVSQCFEGDEPPPLKDATASTHLYRIAQEATQNAARHGKARNIWLDLIIESDRTVLKVRDDGVGVASPDELTKGGMGLQIMNYRARMLGGTVQFDSQAGEGTTVTCTCPHGKEPDAS